MAKHYSVDDVIKMLKYIQTYSKDIREYFLKIKQLHRRGRKLASIISTDSNKMERISSIRERIREKIILLNAKMDRWELELKRLYIKISNTPSGRLSVPTYLPMTESIVYLCVLPETTSDNIEWHFTTEPYDVARPYFEHIS